MTNSYPGINPDIREWKGQEITDFQEDLFIKVNGRLSEKWFYTHIKSEAKSLPRIDVLNMLSKYAGYNNWDDFRFRNSATLPTAKVKSKEVSVFVKVPLILLATVILLFIVYMLMNTQNYRFSFIDADTGEPILDGHIQVDMLMGNESPLSYTCDPNGKLSLRTDQSKIRLVVRSPYYMTDTVDRILKKFNREEQVKLHADANALMIRFFSQNDIKGWQERRNKLDKLFSDDAIIYQVPDDKVLVAMELFNKKEFIDKLSMPAAIPGQIEILGSKYKDGRIAILRFRIKKLSK
ncbi:MAG: hypothetical protein HXX13_07370 [Bacteroidetes bacterium]|nr:hypothetical protein [Bacteroidota bacterium]